jgi:hypothetical protein
MAVYIDGERIHPLGPSVPSEPSVPSQLWSVMRLKDRPALETKGLTV